jgi:Family of unknown function (DUF5995)
MPTGALATIADVIAGMEKIEKDLPPGDGVACFNDMYLQVTQLVSRELAAGTFHDQAFMEQLDVNFAALFFAAIDASDAGAQINHAWKPLFAARGNKAVWPIQFALAGMDAHIGHDLPLAVIKTCLDRGTTPGTAPVHEDYDKVNRLLSQIEARVRERLAPDPDVQGIEPLLHILSGVSISAARDVAWANTELLWHVRDTPLYGQTLHSLTHIVATAGHMLVTPVVEHRRREHPESPRLPSPADGLTHSST